jgi:uncharacterized protein
MAEESPHASDQLKLCAKHNLRFDPKLVRSCVLCRREQERPVEAAPAWAMPLAVVALLGGAVFVGIPIYRAFRTPAPPAGVASGGRSPAAALPFLARCEQPPAPSIAAAELDALAHDCARACDLGAGIGCRRLAGLCSPAAQGQLPPAPETLCKPGSAALLERACAADDPISCTLADEARRAAVLSRACASGLGRTCGELAALCSPERPMLAQGGLPTHLAFLASQEVRDACQPGPQRLLSRGCEQGDVRSCDQLPASMKPDPARLRSIFEAACDRREAAACRGLASLLGADEGGRAAALANFARDLESCQAADGGSCGAVRSWRDRASDERMRGGDRTKVEAAEAACSKGEVVSCWEAQEAYAAGQGVSRSDDRAAALGAQARKLLRESCGGDGGACVSADTERALSACDSGRGQDCIAVARAYPGGLPALARRGARLLIEACERDKGEPCRLAASMMKQGEGMPPDGARALALLRKGCDGRDAESCAEIARQSAAGEGAAKDLSGSERLYRRAAELWTSSCEKGDPAACGHAAELYEAGKGVGRDEARARGLRARQRK